MFIIADFLLALSKVIDILVGILILLIFVRAIISWVNPDPYNPIVQFLHKTTEPILAPIRRALPFSLGIGIDISPVIAFLILIFIKTFFVQLLIDIAVRLR